MPLKAFDHVNVRTANLVAMVQWYDTILDMKAGARPNFSFGGAWLYLGDLALVHLVAQEEQPKSIDPQIEHFAISATGLDDFLAHLENHGVEAKVGKIESFGITQVNIFDPDGNHIHIDFKES
jgi:catechol 2,3-dioxygenase-like lactoylglutathione lyase family enzyme